MADKVQGIILKGVGGFYDVMSTSEDNTLYTCKVRGVHRKDGSMSPLPGDHVLFNILDAGKRVGHIEEFLERNNYFIRPPVSNIDQLAIVVSVVNPEPDLLLVDKLLITCDLKSIKPLILINKADLDHDNRILELRITYESAGYRVLVLSKITHEGYDVLKDFMKGLKTAFAGQSGVGKSTILNNLLEDAYMETGDLSEKIQRGKHTTRHVQLFLMKSGGFVFDTPGFSSYQISEVSHENLQDYYPEFVEHAGSCRFKGCSHINEPDCSIRERVGNGLIDVGRYERYKCFYKELKEQYDNRYRR